MTKQFDADVIVAGAGPAGAAAAIHLCKGGARVLLLDWQSFPRDKVCGDFLSAVSLSELTALDLAHAVRNGANIIRRASVSLDGRPLLDVPLPRVPEFPGFGRVMPRRTFDHLLLSKAVACGAQYLAGHRAVAFRETAHHVEVDVQMGRRTKMFRAPALIGADGSTSVIARQLRGQLPIDHDRMIAVRAYFDGVDGPPDRADLCFSSEAFPGYAWLFPTGERKANVGVGMVLKTLPQSADHLPTVLQRLISDNPALRHRLGGATLTQRIAGWPLTTYNAALPIVSRRVALVGDAAGLINPLNGEGIQYALISGRWAADALLAGFARRGVDRTALKSYADQVEAELRDDLRVSRLFVDLIRNRAMSAFWLDGLQTIAARAAVDPEYAATAGGVLAGVVPTRRVLELGMVRKTLQQALRRAGRQTLVQAVRRPASLASLAVRLTDAALAAARPMLDHRADTERWVMGLGQTAMQVATARVGRSGAPRARGHEEATRRPSKGEEDTWREKAFRARGPVQVPAEDARRRNRHVDAPAATSSGSPGSTRRRRRS